MTSMSRRRFFEAFVPCPSRNESGGAVWRPVGHLSSLPPGHEARVEFERRRIAVRGRDDGFQAVDEQGRNLALRMDSRGQLYVCLTETWAEGSFLSIFTGERNQTSR